MDRRKTDRRGDGSGDLFVLDVQAVAATLWRRRGLLLLCVLLFLIPGLLHVIFKADVYKATANLLLENQSINLTDFQDALPAGKLDSADIDTQIEVLRSPTLAYETLDTLNAKTGKDAEGERYAILRKFLSNLTVAAAGKSRVVSVAYESENPEEAAKIANTHAQQYVDFQTRNKREKVNAINEWIKKQVDQLKADSQKKAAAIQGYRKESGIVLGKNSQELIDQQILDLTAQLVPIETEKLRLEARAGAAGGSKSKDIVELLESDIVRELKMSASRAKQDLESLKASYGTQHPSYIAALNKYQQATADLGRETSNIRTSAAVSLEAVTKQEAMLRQRLEELNREGDELREKQVALESLEAEELANRTLLDNFLARSEEVRSQLDLSRPDVRIESLAETPVSPSGISRTVLLVILVLFSLVAGTGIVLLLELIDRGIEDGDDIKKSLNLRLLGILPRSRNPLSEISTHKNSAYLEEIKRVYLAVSAKKAPQSILVTATQAGEGRSTTALALARYFASINTKAILIDADTAGSSIGKKIDGESSIGLADLLGGKADLQSAIARTDGGLAVISSGNQMTAPIDFLANDRFEQLIVTLKSQYDYIIITCAPVPEKTDAEVLSGYVDQVILVVEWAKVPKKVLKKISVSLRQYAKDVPGVILNKRP